MLGAVIFKVSGTQHLTERGDGQGLLLFNHMINMGFLFSGEKIKWKKRRRERKNAFSKELSSASSSLHYRRK